MTGDKFAGGAHVDDHGAILQVSLGILNGDESRVPVKEKSRNDCSSDKDVDPVHGR
jgi:hypothetical protein